MPAVRRVLVVGGGAAGTAAAVLLAGHGVQVDLAEIQPEVSALGSGITLQGNALRVLRQVGLWPVMQAHGYGFDDLGLRAPDAHGTLLAEFPDVRTGGPDLPATFGMYRPTLARLLIDRAREVGVQVRLGTGPTALRQDDAGVDVTFTDGGTGRYDLVVGADGVRSRVRDLLGVVLETRPLGMGIWRASTRRPGSVVRTDLYYRGPCYIAGYCPTGVDSLYCYLVEPLTDRGGLTPEQGLAVMRDLAGAYHGPWDDIREVLVDPHHVNYARFESHLLERPWNRGRVVLIGDAAHVCPPTFAQGAAQALEDAQVLAELLGAADTLDDTLWTAFMDRRFERAATVVAGSVQLARWLLDGEEGDVPGLMGRTFALLSSPA